MPTLLSVNQFAEKHSAFTKSGLRALIFNEKQNGLANAGAIVRIGRKVLIDEQKFFAWLEAHNQAARVTKASTIFQGNDMSQRLALMRSLLEVLLMMWRIVYLWHSS